MQGYFTKVLGPSAGGYVPPPRKAAVVNDLSERDEERILAALRDVDATMKATAEKADRLWRLVQRRQRGYRR
jgi:hypothetical protein